jgi:hypothetical protein
MNLQVLKYLPTEEEIVMEVYAKFLSDVFYRDCDDSLQTV